MNDWQSRPRDTGIAQVESGAAELGAYSRTAGFAVCRSSATLLGVALERYS